MRSHLDEDVLLDVIEATASAEAMRHARECAFCASRMADARAGLSLAAGAEAPEPSPLFWDAFRGRVASAIDTPPARRLYRGLLLPAFLAAAALAGVIVFLPNDGPAPLIAPASAWPSLPATDGAAGGGFPGAMSVDAASVDDLAECHDVAACVADLSDEESRAFAEELRDELGKSGDL